MELLEGNEEEEEGNDENNNNNEERINLKFNEEKEIINGKQPKGEILFKEIPKFEIKRERIGSNLYIEP